MRAHGNRLHTSQGARGGSKTRIMNVLRGQPNHGQMDIVGNTLVGAQGPPTGSETTNSK